MAANPIVLPHLDIWRDKVKYVVIISYDVVFENKEAEDKYLLWIHHIQDKVLTFLYQYLTVWWRGEGSLNLEHINKMLHKITTAYLGPNMLKKVVINQLQVERL